jgi:hypothetical protein
VIGEWSADVKQGQPRCPLLSRDDIDLMPFNDWGKIRIPLSWAMLQIEKR